MNRVESAHPNTARRTLAALVMTSALLVGMACESDEPVDPVESEDVVPGEAAAFEDVPSLVRAMNSGGVACKDMEQVDAPQETIADFGFCFITPDYEKDIYIFENTEDRDLWVQSLEEVPDIYLLIGPNWFITSGSQPELEDIRGVLGGDLRAPNP